MDLNVDHTISRPASAGPSAQGRIQTVTLSFTNRDDCSEGVCLPACERPLDYLAHVEKAWRVPGWEVAVEWRQWVEAEFHGVGGQRVIGDRPAGASPRLLSQQPLAQLERAA